MSNPHKFDSKYTDYWEQAVKDSIDGSKIPGVNEAKFFLQGMQLNRSDKILELGCSFGRMFEAISSFSDNVYGVDPELSALVKAANKPYKSLDQGFAENTKYKNEFFDAIFCWAVFDVVNQKKGFFEMNRILKKQGKLLLTGKNSNYHLDD